MTSTNYPQIVRLEQMHMHAKYEVSICNGSKVMANFKVVLKQTNRQREKQTGQKNMPPRSYLGGIKSVVLEANRLEPRSGPTYVGPDLGSSLFTIL